MGFFADGVLPDGKGALRPLPATADPTKWVSHTDWNSLCAGVKDLRTNMHKATTKGDLLVYDGTTYQRLPVGTNTHVLTADSAQTLGIKWAAGGGGGASYYQTLQANAVDQTQRDKLNFSASFSLADSASPSRTTVSLAATDSTTQTLSNKTLTAPVINGATSASGNFDLSGSTGTFKTSTGACTYGGSSNTFSADVKPSTDNSSYLGDSTHHWAGLYAAQVYNAGGSLVLGSTSSYVRLAPVSGSYTAVRLDGADVWQAYTDRMLVTPNVATSGAKTALTITGAANTGQTASTEVPDFDLALNRTVQWATGALTTQRAMVVRAPTYAFVGASTLTNAATLAITGAPSAGANATITNAYALWVQAGVARFDGGIDGVGYIGQNDQSALGTATTSSTTFVDVGNGSSTGFASWTAPAAKVTKTYTLSVTVRAYVPTVGSTGTVSFQVLQDGVAIGSQPTEVARISASSSTQYLSVSWRIPVSQTSGVAHVYKLQWKVGNASDQAGVTTGVGQLQFYLTG